VAVLNGNVLNFIDGMSAFDDGLPI
jgi:hypothetical protein